MAPTIGFLKERSAVRIYRELPEARRMMGLHFWATGYSVSTVRLDEAAIQKYVREQEERDSRQGDLGLD